MSDYPNMSYCMFENTSNAMDQIASALEDAIENNELLELNAYEERPFTSMYDKCVSLMRLLEQYDDMQAQINADECREEEDDAIDES